MKAVWHFPDLFDNRYFKLSQITRTLYFRLSSPLFYSSTALLCCHQLYAQEYFNPGLLQLGSGVDSALVSAPVDLSHFEQGGQLPGNYRVDIYLNQHYVNTQAITFVSGKDNDLLPSLTKAQYAAMGVKVNSISALAKLADDKVIEQIGQYIAQASSSFDFAKQRLNISIPQIALMQQAQGYVDPAAWSEGMSAALLNYSITGSSTHNRQWGGNSNNLFANLQSGVNLGAWRLRNYSTFTQGDHQHHFQSINSYLQRAIKPLQSELTLGDSSTEDEVFDSFQMRGVQLATDMSMLPDSLRGYAPIIRGSARSNAQVTIRQNGSVVYQTYVAPGAFAISDMAPTSLSGDLLVTVKEADGSEHSFTQAFSSVALMQRESQLKYSASIGRYRNSGLNSRTPNFMQTTAIYGLAHDTTLYGGLILSRDYQAETLGLGIGLGELGAISADITQANTHLYNDEHHQGQSYRLRYSKSQVETGTTLTLAAYRYSTRGYYSFQDANTLPDATYASGNNSWFERKRSEFQLSLDQQLSDYGSLYLSLDQSDYWTTTERRRTYSVGYGNSWQGVSYNLNLSESHDNFTDNPNRQLTLNISLPLNQWLWPSRYNNNLSANYSLTTDNRGNSQQQAGVSGTLVDNRLNYNLSQNYGNHGTGYGGSVNASYRSSYGVWGGGYNYSRQQQQWNYSVQGGVVAHPYGITLSQPLSETIALVKAPKAADVKVSNGTGLYTDNRGYAVVTNLQPYRQTAIDLDAGSLPSNVAMEMTSTSVVPTRGALVLADYNTVVGQQVLMNLTYQGKAVPFGALVKLTNATNNQSAIVGDNGQVYLVGVPAQGNAMVVWGEASNQHCQVHFVLPASLGTSDVSQLNQTCQ